jgi:hypothetical protein
MTAPLAIDPTTSSRTLRIRPRAALLAIHTDALLEDPYRVEWRGAEPTVDDRGRSVEVGYTAGARLRALTPRRGSLSVALHPNVPWAIELDGGVSGLRADLRDLQLPGIAISGGAGDVVLDLPQPRDRLILRIEGGLSGAIVRRPAGVPVALEIQGGARRLKLDQMDLGAIGGVVRQRTLAESRARGDGEIVVQVLGGASRLTIDAHDH